MFIGIEKEWDKRVARLSEHNIPLREQKFALTKISLMENFLKDLSQKKLEEVNIKDLCERIHISEPTFFNYFRKKTELVEYWVNLWRLEAECRLVNTPVKNEWNKVEVYFHNAADLFEKSPRIFAELLGHQDRDESKKTLAELTKAERILGLPQMPGVLNVKPKGLNHALKEILEGCIAKGEIPASSDIDTIVVLLNSLFYGVPMNYLFEQPQKIVTYYDNGLRTIFNGIRTE